MTNSSRKVIEAFRERIGQPFVVEAEPVSGDDETGYDVKLMPEMQCVSISIFALRVYLDGERIQSEMGEAWQGEPDVERVTLIDQPHGGTGSVVELSSDPESASFEIESTSTATQSHEEIYQRIEE